jgi:hypothetical protein
MVLAPVVDDGVLSSVVLGTGVLVSSTVVDVLASGIAPTGEVI